MGIFSSIYNQLANHPNPLPAGVRLEGQTAIVTGANVGLGLESARQLAEHGLSLAILAVRSPDKGEAAKLELSKSMPKCNFEVWELDYNDYGSIQAFAERAQLLDRLDMVLLNSGVMQKKYVKSTTGHELQLQVNYLATALLSLLLLPVLRSSTTKTGKAGRITMTNSELHEWISFKQRRQEHIFDHLDQEKFFTMENYGVTKLLLLLWAQELASRVSSSEVIINSVNPGLCWSSLHRDMDNAGFRAYKHMVAWSSAEGASTLIDGLVTQPVGSHGKYISFQKITPPAKFATSQEGQKYQKKLWDDTLAELGKEVSNLPSP